jgi:hypothetical protein
MNEAKLEVQFMSFLPEATGSSRQARSAWSKLLQGVLAPVGLPQWPLRRQPHHPPASIGQELGTNNNR